MLVVVGLGNPGREYEKTRHNIGFEAIERTAIAHGFPIFKNWKKSLVSKGAIDGYAALLVMPQTYMNLSGDSVGRILKFYKLTTTNLIVIHDELDFEPGMMKLKSGGGTGGHNGLSSISAHVGPDFARIRLGIGKPQGKQSGADFVLSKFDPSSRHEMDEAVEKSVKALTLIAKMGIAHAMNELNRRNR
ncbi:MAG: aminoacyl-tRNA hydrolase [Myxococcota bacterium]|nr:aminoacyl-tRNA hydrolase [Myxococcota bacterium]